MSEWRVDRFAIDGARLPRAHKYPGINKALSAAVRFFESGGHAVILTLVESPIDGNPEPVSILYQAGPRSVIVDHALGREDLGGTMSGVATKAQKHVSNAFRCGVRSSKHHPEWSTR
jgi:hypothetical protein